MVPLSSLPEAAGRADKQDKKALRDLLTVRGADVRSRKGGNRGLWKACRAGAESGRADASRPPRTTLQAEVSRLHKVLLGESGIGGDQRIEINQRAILDNEADAETRLVHRPFARRGRTD